MTDTQGKIISPAYPRFWSPDALLTAHPADVFERAGKLDGDLDGGRTPRASQ